MKKSLLSLFFFLAFIIAASAQTAKAKTKAVTKTTDAAKSNGQANVTLTNETKIKMLEQAKKQQTGSKKTLAVTKAQANDASRDTDPRSK